MPPSVATVLPRRVSALYEHCHARADLVFAPGPPTSGARMPDGWIEGRDRRTARRPVPTSRPAESCPRRRSERSKTHRRRRLTCRRPRPGRDHESRETGIVRTGVQHPQPVARPRPRPAPPARPRRSATWAPSRRRQSRGARARPTGAGALRNASIPSPESRGRGARQSRGTTTCRPPASRDRGNDGTPPSFPTRTSVRKDFAPRLPRSSIKAVPDARASPLPRCSGTVPLAMRQADASRCATSQNAVTRPSIVATRDTARSSPRRRIVAPKASRVGATGIGQFEKAAHTASREISSEKRSAGSMFIPAAASVPSVATRFRGRGRSIPRRWTARCSARTSADDPSGPSRGSR